MIRDFLHNNHQRINLKSFVVHILRMSWCHGITYYYFILQLKSSYNTQCKNLPIKDHFKFDQSQYMGIVFSNSVGTWLFHVQYSDKIISREYVYVKLRSLRNDFSCLLMYFILDVMMCLVLFMFHFCLYILQWKTRRLHLCTIAFFRIFRIPVIFKSF